MGFVALMMIGKLGPAVDGATPQYDAADLIELADAPALIEAPRVARPEETGSEALVAVRDEVADGAAVAGPSVSLEDGNETADGVEPTDPQTRGEAALARISYPWQQLLPGWTIEFLPEKSGLFGLTLVPEKRIEVYVRDTQTEELLAHVIAHELGHAVDVTLNNGPDRRAWAEARGTGSSPWWPGNGTSDFSTGAGDFAESFAAWQVGSGSFRSTLADPPTTAQIDLLAQLSAG